ncbi:MAG: Ig-like domain-containing protein, partial [Halanaerobium sp.]
MSNRKSMLIFLILTVFFLIISGCDGTTDDSLQETRTSMDLGITAGDGDILIEGEKADLDKEYFFDRDEKVTLEAVPAEDYGLSEWSTGDTETEITLVMTEDQNLTAEFLLEPQIDGNIEAAEVETGRSLEDSELTGTFQHPRGENEEIKGDLDWSNKEKLVSSAGDYEWTFTVDDTEYEEGEVLSEIKGEVKVEVITVEPEPEEDTLNAGKIEAGESLSSSELEGEFVNPHSSELNVDGELEWEAPDEEVKSPGDFEWEFVPEDDDSYEETEGEVYVGVVEDDKELPFAEITAFDALADAEQGEEIGDNVTGTVKNQGDETESKTIEVRFTDDGSYDDEVLYTTDKKLDADEEYDLGDEIAAEDVVIPDDAETGDQTIELWTEDDSSSQTINIESATDVSAEADTGTATADGSDELQFTVTVEDADSNPVEGVQVITEDDAAGTVSYDGDDDQTTDENGEIEVKANSEDAEENITFTFTAKESGDENSDTAKGTFEAGKVDTIDAEDITVTAGEEGTINVIAEDEYGNKVEGETISVEEADGLDGISSGEEADTNSEGIASFTFTEDTAD